MPPRQDLERRPLLSQDSSNRSNSRLNGHEQPEEIVEFSDDDPEDPRQWPLSAKYIQTLQIFILALICPMASSIIAPAMDDISSEYGTSRQLTIAAQSGFVCMLGVGPLFLAPMSETFGRRPIFVTNLAIFTLLQIPTALAPSIEAFVTLRTIGGFFGSVGVANGGGSISDMFETRDRAQVLGFYMAAPLLGPTLGPFLGAFLLGSLQWRWLFWIVLILSGLITAMLYFFLHETQAKTILQQRKKKLEQNNKGKKYKVEGVSDMSILAKVGKNSTRAVRILSTQPIVMTMSLYQALVFSSMYTLYSQYTSIWSSPPYNFSITQVGLAYLSPAVGFIITAVLVVAYIDKVYVWLTERNGHEKGRPEYRLPLANVGAIALPTSLFWFGWAVEYGRPWPIPLAATLLFGASQISIFNTVQNYYIDSFESNAASALAAGAFLRSMFGGIIPLFVGGMFDSLGYGWGMSVFGFLAVLLMPAPTLFYYYGSALREKFPFKP